MNKSYFLAFCNKYGFSPCYEPKGEKELRKKIHNTDFFIADDKCTHRMVGIYWRIGSEQAPIVTVVCSRTEMVLAKKIAFENGKKIFCDSQASAHLFHNYYGGEEIYPGDFHYIFRYYIKFLKKQRKMKKRM